MNTPHRIVVVGGGAAGLQLATQAGDRFGRRGLAEVTLVERARTHLWKPLLHAVAAGSMDPGKHEVNYLAHAHAHHFRYHLGELTGLDRPMHEHEHHYREYSQFQHGVPENCLARVRQLGYFCSEHQYPSDYCNQRHHEEWLGH